VERYHCEAVSNMTGRSYTVDQSHLILAVARGDSVKAWARANHVPKSTAYRWARSPEVRRTVEAARRCVIERAAGILAARADWACGQIEKIATNAESQSVRLQAYRALSSERGLSRFMKLNDLARFPDSTPLGEAYVHPARQVPRPLGYRSGHLERRLARLEADIRGRTGTAVLSSELATAWNKTKRKQRASDRGVLFTLPLVSEGSRPACAQVENRDLGDTENR
jgi:hypothetical protein